MEVNSTSSAIAATAGSRSSDEGLGDISSNDFMNLLITQLQYQDPFEPMDNEEMLNQMSTIRELELTTRLTDKIDQLTDQQRFASVASLIGKFVRGEVGDGEGSTLTVEGTVSSITFTKEGNILLELEDGTKLPLADLQHISDLPEA